MLMKKAVYILLLMSIALNAFLGFKALSRGNAQSETEIIFDRIKPEDINKAKNIILAKGTAQYPEDLVSYLLDVDNNGKINAIYEIEGTYDSLSYDEEADRIYIVSG